MPTYNSNANVYTLAEALTQSPDLKGKIWSKMLEVQSNTTDDFAELEGPPESKKPFWKKRDLSKDGGDTIIFSTIGDVAGPGVRGEIELTGKTSKPRMGTYFCVVDYLRDATELTKKQIKFLAAGKSVESVVLKMLGDKMGRRKMYDMMHCLIRTPSVTVLRPGNKTSTNALRHTDTLTPSFLTDAKARLQGRGGRPTDVLKSKSGSPVMRYLGFICQDAMVDIRNSTSYQTALASAQERGDGNGLFSGRLVDWNAISLWEHTVVDPDSNDAIGSPIAPKALLGAAITAANTTFILKSGEDGTNTLCEYFRDFPGFDYLFTEDQTAAPDAGTYYFWVLNMTGGAAGLAGFYSYTGSDNNGNQIVAIQGRLRAAASGIAVTTLGNVVWDAATMTDSHPVGSIIIPANAYGVPTSRSFMLGAGSALRAYGSTEMEPIAQDRDYKFVKGMGYESIYGQAAAKDTKGVPRHYLIMETAFEHPGLRVPYLAN